MEKLDIDIEAKHGEANQIESWQDDTNSFGNEYLPNLTTLAILGDMLKLVKTLQAMFFQQRFVGGFEGAKKP
jgi:hypothetical protein